MPSPVHPRPRRTTDGHRVWASWVHLSDIHFGHGDAAHQADQELMLDALFTELRGDPPGGVPRPQMMLITGDIAFSGARRSSDEYDRARDQLAEAAAACGLSLEQVYAVPGNHDVDAGATRGRANQHAFAAYRGGAPIDEALSDAGMVQIIRQRMAGYLAFTEHLAPACRDLYWQTRIDTGDRPIRLVGLNTALLADQSGDRGALQLGKRQLGDTLRGITRDEVVIVLSHHPITGGWLADQTFTRRYLRRQAHVHLCGHVHDAETSDQRAGGGQVLVTIAAGATHNAAYPGAGHGFNYAALIQKGDAYAIRVWPRRFAPSQFGFVVDTTGVGGDGAHWADHLIQAG